MVVASTRARYRFTADQRRHMTEIGIPPGNEHHFTFDEYVRLWEAGIFGPDERVELIEGEVIEMAGPEAPHANAVRNANRLLSRIVPDGFVADAQNPIRLSTDGAPLPDLAVLYDRTYDTLPSEADVLLVVEVSDSTLRYDRGDKLRTYAKAGIPEVWIVNIGTREIERYTEPQGETYGQLATAQPDKSLVSTTVPGVVIPVADVLR